jgi:hypothetical protein
VALGEEDLADGETENASGESAGAIQDFDGMGEPGAVRRHEGGDDVRAHALRAGFGASAYDGGKVPIEGDAEVFVS